MLTQPTLEKLIAMRLRGMAEAFRQQQESADSQRLSFEERLGLLIDRQWNWRQNRALERRLRQGRLQGPACVEDIDYRTARGGRGEEFRRLCAGAEGLPRGILGAVPARGSAVSRPGDRPRRRQSAPPAGALDSHRSAGDR